MAYMENARRARAGASKPGGFEAHNTPRDCEIQAAVGALAAGLICLPHPMDMAFILRRLDLNQRVWLALGALLSLPETDARDVAEAALADIATWRQSPLETEAERMRRQWTFHCRDQRRRPTTLTAAETRRAAAISFDDSARAALAAAWVAATTSDRRDLIERAIGSTSNGL